MSLVTSAMLNPRGFAWVPDFKLDEGQLQSAVISQGFGVVCQRAFRASLTCRLLDAQLTHLSPALKEQRNMGVEGGRRRNRHHPSHPNAASEKEGIRSGTVVVYMLWRNANQFRHGKRKERSTMTCRVSGNI